MKIFVIRNFGPKEVRKHCYHVIVILDVLRTTFHIKVDWILPKFSTPEFAAKTHANPEVCNDAHKAASYFIQGKKEKRRYFETARSLNKKLSAKHGQQLGGHQAMIYSALL